MARITVLPKLARVVEVGSAITSVITDTEMWAPSTEARHVNWAANFIAPWARLTSWERSWLNRSPSHRAAAGVPMWDSPSDDPIRWRSTNPPWSECTAYGSPPGVPDHIAFMVMIVVDQLMHVVVNWAALRWLG